MTTNSLREYKIKRTSSAQRRFIFTSQSITKLLTKIFVAHFHEYACNSVFIVRQIYTVYFCIASLDMSVSDDVANVLRTIAKLVGTKAIFVCRFQKHVIPFFAKCRAYKYLIKFVSTGIKLDVHYGPVTISVNVILMQGRLCYQLFAFALYTMFKLSL